MPRGKPKAGRASNGMGSVRKRKNGSWEGRYTGADGRQHSVYGKTEKEAATKLRQKLHEVDTGSWLEPTTLTVGDWLEIWLTDYCADTNERTINKNRCVFKKHFDPIVGKVKLTTLQEIHVQRLVTSLSRKGLANSTVKNYMGVFTAALNQAKRSRLIQQNPADHMSLSGTAKKEFHVVDRQQLPAFFEAAMNTRYPFELTFGILTGLRVGEIRGLRWADVDFDAGTIYVRQQLKPKYRNMDRVTLPKYDKKRLFHVPAEAMNILKKQRRRQAEQRIACGDKWCDDAIAHDLVFRQPNGKAHSERTIAYAVKAVGVAIGIPDLHPHDLRHSYAVAILRAGADVKTVQHNLGHATVEMTLNVYAAYTQDAGQQCAEKLSQYVRDMGI